MAQCFNKALAQYVSSFSRAKLTVYYLIISDVANMPHPNFVREDTDVASSA